MVYTLLFIAEKVRLVQSLKLDFLARGAKYFRKYKPSNEHAVLRRETVVDELLNLIESLRKRITDHDALLRGSEALTRYVLVDPLLRCLGWDTEDPTHVVPEYKIPSEPTHAADYALFAGADIPRVIVEVKRLGHAAYSNAASQALGYCMHDGFNCFVVTDGQRWAVYETLKEGNLANKQIANFDIRVNSVPDACLNALCLWRERFNDGSPPVAIATPSMPGGIKVPPEIGGGIQLSKLQPKAGTKPQSLLFPDGSVVPVTSWAQTLTKLTEWLGKQGYITKNHLPIHGKGSKFLVATQPKHGDGKNFNSPKPAAEFWVDTNYNSGRIAQNMRVIIEHVGMDSSEFRIRMQ